MRFFLRHFVVIFCVLLPLSAHGAQSAESRTAGTQVSNVKTAVSAAKPLLPEEAQLPFSPDELQAAKIVVIKGQRRMDLLDKDGWVIRSYRISLGKTPSGDKREQGDNKTPEGEYTISGRNPNSSYNLSLKISYPNPSDEWRAKRMGVPPGGDIMIHGLPNDRGWMWWKYSKDHDWTNGCIAVYNDEIREIWKLVPDGTTILIKP